MDKSSPRPSRCKLMNRFLSTSERLVKKRLSENLVNSNLSLLTQLSKRTTLRNIRATSSGLTHSWIYLTSSMHGNRCSRKRNLVSMMSLLLLLMRDIQFSLYSFIEFRHTKKFLINSKVKILRMSSICYKDQ